MSEVTNNISNQTKCLCPVCPVQADSDCTNTKSSAWKDMRRSVGRVLEEYPDHPETYEMEVEELKQTEVGRRSGAQKITRDTMIELYCSIGKTSCRDLERSQNCVCPDCSVWINSGLRSQYFCFRGSAAEAE